VIWHILKKDLRLLWPVAAVVAAVQTVNAVLLCCGGEFERSDSPSTALSLISNAALPLVSLLGLVILVIAVAQQDRFPGTTQDWLTRPVARHQLVGAKLLFVLLVGLGPILVCDITMGVIAHLRVTDVVAASLTRSMALFGLVCLPALMLGIVTRSLGQALVLGVALAVVLILEIIAFSQLRRDLPLLQSGFAWSIGLALLIVNVLATAVVMPLQVHWRSTERVRGIVVVFLCAVPALAFLPWSVGFGLQQVMTGRSSHAAPVVQIDPNRKTTFSIDGPREYQDYAKDPRVVNLQVPLADSTALVGTPWALDRVVADVIDPKGGAVLASLPGWAGRNTLERTARRPVLLQMPVTLFQITRAGHASIRATLFVTTFHSTAAQTIGSLKGRALDEFSRCYGDYEKSVSCVSTRPVGTCVHLDDRSSSGQNMNDEIYEPDYSCRGVTYTPWPLPLWRDPYYTFEATRWGSSLDSRVLTNYVPDAHFKVDFEFNLDGAIENKTHSARSVDGFGKEARFANPEQIALDSHGTVFVVDDADSIIRKVTPSGEVSTYAGKAGQIGHDDGPSRDARFAHPQGIATDAADNLYVADTGNGLIRKISPAGVVSTIEAHLVRPTRIVCGRDGAVYVVDYDAGGNSVVRMVSTDGVVSTLAGPDGSN
jgi:hypothetical protein